MTTETEKETVEYGLDEEPPSEVLENESHLTYRENSVVAEFEREYYECDECGKVFNSSQELASHVKNEHND